MSEQRYIVAKASGSRYAYVIDTHGGGSLARFDILKGDNWNHAVRMRDRLNAKVAQTEPPSAASEG